MTKEYKKSYIVFRDKVWQKKADYLKNKSHRSFKLSRRRDYKKELELPGYIAFTAYVNGFLIKNRKMIIKLAMTYAVLTAGLVGMASQDIYTSLSDVLRETSSNITSGDINQVGQAALLLVTGVTGGMTQNLSEAQQIFAYLIIILIWLASVWALRNIMSGSKFNLRDVLYNSASPLISTFLVSLLLVVQLIPVAIAMIAYSAASVSGLLDGGVPAMLFWIGFLLLIVMSLYLVTSTFMSLIVVTIPGMYPLRAIKTGSQIVSGRRLRIIYRLLWAGLMIALTWLIIMIPIILLDTWLKGWLTNLEWLPIVPVTLLIMSSLTVVWFASYNYLLYRKIVDDVAKRA